MGTFRIYEDQIQESEPSVSDAKEREIVSPRFDRGETLRTREFSNDGTSSPPSSVSIQIDRHQSSATAPDTCSIASTSSLSSSSSSASVMIDPGKKQHFATQGSVTATPKVLGPATDNQNRSQSQCQPPHARIRRVPSTANPKYKIPKLGRARSHSQPQLQFHSIQSQRRNSSPSNLAFANGQPGHSTNPKLPNSHSNPSDYPSNPVNCPAQLQQQPQHQSQQQSKSGTAQQQQQIIYLQIPQPTQSQMYDPQALQQQISSQLQMLVPQIYSQLLHQIVPPTTKSSETAAVEEETNYPEVQSQRVMNQIYDMTSNADPKNQSSSNLGKKQHKSNSPQHQQQQHQQQQPITKQSNSNIIQSTEISTQISAEDISKYLQIENISQILQQIPAHILQQNTSSDQTSYIEIQQLPGFPKITIPITQELLLQCQQFQQNRDMGFIPYSPRLETILEESMSVKHLKMTKSSPKTKIIACILTVLCVVVVVLLAGDKTVAVVIVAVVFILFLLASIFYLYVNSSKSQLALSHADSQKRIQVSTISTCDKPSSMV